LQSPEFSFADFLCELLCTLFYIVSDVHFAFASPGRAVVAMVHNSMAFFVEAGIQFWGGGPRGSQGFMGACREGPVYSLLARSALPSFRDAAVSFRIFAEPCPYNELLDLWQQILQE
jgi:hypothetical protein